MIMLPMEQVLGGDDRQPAQMVASCSLLDPVIYHFLLRTPPGPDYTGCPDGPD